MSSQTPIQSDQFIVKVKLLSNQVYEFVIDPQTTKVNDLKQMILDKINVPVDRQRIVFGGKQLLDQNHVIEYVKNSGMTVHLIAKTPQQQQQQQQQTNTTTNTTNTTNTTQQQQIPPLIPPPLTNNNPFGNIMGMFSGLGVPQTASMTIGNLNDLPSSLNGILGGFGIRVNNTGNNNINMNNINRVNMNNNNNTNGSSSSSSNINTNNMYQTPPNRRQQQHNNMNNNNNINTSTFINNNNNNNINNNTNNNTNNNNQSSNNAFRVSTQPILSLNQVISSMNLPTQPVLQDNHMSLRQQTSQYLRRLQHQYMRMIPQLNRSIQLLNQGRITHLNQVVRLLEAINMANNHGIEAVNVLRGMNNNNNNNSNNVNNNNNTNNNTTTTNINPTSSNIQLNQNQPMQIQQNPTISNVQATIIIQQDDILDDDIDQQPTNFNNINNNNNNNNPNTRTNTTTINLGNLGNLSNLNNMGGLSDLLGSLTGQLGGGSVSVNVNGQNVNTNNGQSNPLGGFNLGGLMSMFGGGNGQNSFNLGNMNINQSNQQQPQVPPQVPPQQPQVPPSQQPQSQPQQSQQIPPPEMNITNLASIFFPQSGINQSTSSSSSSIPTSPSSQPPNPLGGMNIMNIFSSLQQSGGMGQIINMSLGQMLQQGSNQPNIYSKLFKSLTGGDLLNCFTSKNFQFLDRKYQSIRQNFLQAISLAGCQQDLVNKISQDITRLLIPIDNVNNKQQCINQIKSIIRKYVQHIARVTMNKGNQKYSQKLINYLKLAFCQSIMLLSTYINTNNISNQTAQQYIFANIRTNSIQIMDQFIQGLSGMFYSFIQRDLIRVYNQYKQQMKRKKQRSQEQIKSEEDLIRLIETEAKKDIDYLKGFKHSQYYHPNNKE